MGLRLWKSDVIDRLGLGGGGFPGFGEHAVFREGVPDETHLRRFPDLRVRPYVVVWFGARIPSVTEAAVCGERASAHTMVMAVHVSANDGVTCDDAVDLVSDLLRGFRPAAQGELREWAVGTIRRPMDVSGVQSRYQIPVTYRGLVDL